MPESKAIARVLSSGYMLDAKAFELISSLPTETDAEALVDKLLEQKASTPSEAKVITESDVAKLVPLEEPHEETSMPVQSPAELEVLSDPTQAIAPAEGAEGFVRLFRDRYQRLSSIVRERLDTKNSATVSATKNLAPGKKVKVAGLLAERSSRRGSVELRVDDPTGSLKVVCQDVAEKAALEAPLDSMVVVEVSRGRSGQMFTDSIVLPDVPGRRAVSSSHRVYAVLLSDLHVGSRMFLGDDFHRFLQWLNGSYGDSDLVNRIKYVVVAGDLVDGVGVYPGQEFQLAERDPKKQYELYQFAMSWWR